jgi:hypothetical protein
MCPRPGHQRGGSGREGPVILQFVSPSFPARFELLLLLLLEYYYELLSVAVSARYLSSAERTRRSPAQASTGTLARCCLAPGAWGCVHGEARQRTITAEPVQLLQLAACRVTWSAHSELTVADQALELLSQQLDGVRIQIRQLGSQLVMPPLAAYFRYASSPSRVDCSAVNTLYASLLMGEPTELELRSCVVMLSLSLFRPLDPGAASYRPLGHHQAAGAMNTLLTITAAPPSNSRWRCFLAVARGCY